MILDDVYKTMAYKAPPVSMDAAIERMQLVYAEDETLAECRQASQAPPTDHKAAIKRVQAAGIHCTNMIGMKWKNIEQLQAAMAEFNWRVQFYCDSKTMDFGPARLLIGIARATDHKMLLWLHEEPYASTILGAKMLAANRKAQNVLKRIDEFVRERCNHNEI